MTTIAITVQGRPQPAGSKRAFPIRRGGKVTGVAVTDDAKRSRPWKDSVTAAALEHLNGDPLAGPLILEIDFFVARPAGHYGSGRNHDVIKASAPLYPAVRPDLTKYIRAVEDALTDAGAWRDDAQVVTQIARKRYGRPERAEIRIKDLNEPVNHMRELGGLATEIA